MCVLVVSAVIGYICFAGSFLSLRHLTGLYGQVVRGSQIGIEQHWWRSYLSKSGDQPKDFSEIPNAPNLLDIPAYIVHVPWMPERLQFSLRNVKDAGFRNVTLVEGINGKNQTLCASLWQEFGIDANLMGKMGQRQGLNLAQLLLLRKMIVEKIDFAIHFEDDVVFHKDWASLWPQYWQKTPPTFHVLYMGSIARNAQDFVLDTDHMIGSWPCWGAHALIFSQVCFRRKTFDYGYRLKFDFFFSVRSGHSWFSTLQLIN